MRTADFIGNPSLQRVILNTGKKIGGNNITIQELVRAAYTVEALLALDINNTEVQINGVNYDITQYQIPTTLEWMTDVRGVTKNGLLYEPLIFRFESSKPADVTLMTPQEMFEFGIRWFANYKSEPAYLKLDIPNGYTPLANVADRFIYNGQVKSSFNGILPIRVDPHYIELTEHTFTYNDDVILVMMAALTTYYSNLANK